MKVLSQFSLRISLEIIFLNRLMCEEGDEYGSSKPIDLEAAQDFLDGIQS
jgi:hypothetical protein